MTTRFFFCCCRRFSYLPPSSICDSLHEDDCDMVRDEDRKQGLEADPMDTMVDEEDVRKDATELDADVDRVIDRRTC